MISGCWKVERLVDVEARMPPMRDWLSASESERLAGLRLESRRRQYLAGHWLAREALGQLGGWDPAVSQLIERKGAAPGVESPAGGLYISISHTSDWLAAAAAQGPVGIDIEHADRSHRLFDVADKLAAMGEDPTTLDTAALLRRWVAKEAWIKCTRGAALPDRLLQIALGQRGEPAPRVGVFARDPLVVGLAGPSGLRGIRPRVDRADRLDSWQVVDHGLPARCPTVDSV